MAYEVESYWNKVAKQLDARNGGGEIAGDDDPFYFYKREKFLQLFRKQQFNNKKILEVGCGPGGNLEELFALGPKSVSGVDISSEMLKIASSNPRLKNVSFSKVDGLTLPFPNESFDLIYTVTVLQHIVDQSMLTSIINDICRVSVSEILIFERIEKTRKEISTNIGRTVEEYQNLFSKNGFVLEGVESLNINASYYVCGAIRRLFNSKNRKEGEPQSKLAVGLQKLALPITKLLDPLLPLGRDLNLLHFKKQ